MASGSVIAGKLPIFIAFSRRTLNRLNDYNIDDARGAVLGKPPGSEKPSLL
jgi:hypothetical protein